MENYNEETIHTPRPCLSSLTILHIQNSWYASKVVLVVTIMVSSLKQHTQKKNKKMDSDRAKKFLYNKKTGIMKK